MYFKCSESKKILYALLLVFVDFFNHQSVDVGMLCDRTSVVDLPSVGPTRSWRNPSLVRWQHHLVGGSMCQRFCSRRSSSGHLVLHLLAWWAGFGICEIGLVCFGLGMMVAILLDRRCESAYRFLSYPHAVDDKPGLVSLVLSAFRSRIACQIHLSILWP